MISTAATTFHVTDPLFVLYYTHIHWNDKEAIGTFVPMAFCDGKESGGSRIAGFHITLEPKAGDIDFHKLQ